MPGSANTKTDKFHKLELLSLESAGGRAEERLIKRTIRSEDDDRIASLQIIDGGLICYIGMYDEFL